VMRFEAVFLREIGYRPVVEVCVSCGGELSQRRGRLAFSSSAGGALCPGCQPRYHEQRPLSDGCWQILCTLDRPGTDWKGPWDRAVRGEARQVLGGYITWLRGTRPRMLPYMSG